MLQNTRMLSWLAPGGRSICKAGPWFHCISICSGPWPIFINCLLKSNKRRKTNYLHWRTMSSKSVFLNWGNLLPGNIKDVFSCHSKEGVWWMSSEWRQEMPLSNLPGTKQSQITNSYLTKNVSNAKIEKPWAEDRRTINSGVPVNINSRNSERGRRSPFAMFTNLHGFHATTVSDFKLTQGGMKCRTEKRRRSRIQLHPTSS